MIERRVEAGGLHFHVLEEGAGDRLALCLHGFPECAWSWRHQLPLLAGLGLRAWAPDLRGYGGSDAPPEVADYAIEALLGDVAGWIDAAGARGRTTLVAHDWGAIIAWCFAMREPEALERLVIMNVPHPAAARRQVSLRQLARSWYMAFFQLPGLPEWLASRVGPDWPVRLIRRTAAHPERFDDAAMTQFCLGASPASAASSARTAAPMFHYYRAAIRGGGFARQRRLGLPEIRIPTLMIWGEQDVALTKRLTFGTVDHVPNLVQRYLPDASHWVQQDQPELVNAMLEAWLQGLPVPHAPGATADLG